VLLIGQHTVSSRAFIPGYSHTAEKNTDRKQHLVEEAKINLESVHLLWMDEWMDRWMDGEIDGWTDGWMDGWMDG